MLECFACNQKFEDRKRLTEHQIAEHFKCPICKKVFLSNGGMAIHYLRTHKNTNPIPQYPNAIPEVGSSDNDKIGTKAEVNQPEMLSVSSGGQVENALSKLTAVDMPSFNPVDAVVALTEVVESTPHSKLDPLQPIFNSPLHLTPLSTMNFVATPLPRIGGTDDKSLVAEISTPGQGSSTSKPVTKSIYNKVIFAWNDEDMSMEEKRFISYAR